jgi:DNA topoisomerase-1
MARYPTSAKYDRLVPFARALPALRRRLRADLSAAALTRDKVVATVIDLLQKTWLRIGNPEYARSNRSFGLTTLRDGHVRIQGAELLFEFRGKSGVRQRVRLTDARLARIVRRCQELPGQDLFQYVGDDGRRRTVTSADVNAYLRDTMGAPFTAKDFRTWAGTVLAALALRELAPPASSRRARSTMLRAVEKVAQHLSNTPSVCRACYIHPMVLDAYVAGTLSARLEAAPRLRGLSDQEAAVLGLLETSADWRSARAESAHAA